MTQLATTEPFEKYAQPALEALCEHLQAPMPKAVV